MEKGNIQFWFGFVFSFTIGEKKRGTLHIPNNLTYVLSEKKTISCPYITREKFYKIEKKHNKILGNKKEIGIIFKEKKK